MDAWEIDPANRAQARAWDGADGDFWAANADRFDRTVGGFQQPFLAAAAIQPDDHVLDIGCGTGQTSRDAARLAFRGRVLGLDLSRRMIEVARHRAEVARLGNVRFEQADAQTRRFADGEFDVAISRTGSMFFGDPPTAFSNLARALRPGGRLALLTWQPLTANEWVCAFLTALTERSPADPPPDVPGPFSLADPAHVRRLLSGCGLIDIELTAQQAPMCCGRDVDEAESWVLGQLGWMLDGLDAPSRPAARDRLRASLEAHQTPAGVAYDAATWIVTAQRPTDAERSENVVADEG